MTNRPTRAPAGDLTVAMDRAVVLAAERLGATSPNPTVGCVILDAAGRVVGEGAHERAGEPHAEINALAAAGEAARGGTAVITLEPCDHTGRTGPCTEALLAAGVASVRYAVADPTAAGGGAAALSAAGIDVAVAPHRLAERVLEPWLTAQRLGRPHVHLKVGATLDGRVAAPDGSSRWITSADARTDAHRMRATVDAIVIGTQTALTDDPHLTVRHDVARSGVPPLRVVVGRRPLPADARVRDDAAETLLLPDHDPHRVLAVLAERGVVSVLLEGGPHLAGAFLAAGCVDRVTAYTAPLLLGAGPSLLAGPAATLTDAVRLVFDDVTPIGPDLRISAWVAREED